MSEFTFNCPSCGIAISAEDEMRGGEASCPGCGASLHVPELRLEPGLTLDGFALVRRLGAGGMGEVWLAKQESLNRHIALKVLSRKVASDPDFVSRFEQEVKILGRLNHPNIITAYQAGVAKGLRYLAMEYIDGAELSSRLKIDKVIPEADALRLGRRIAEALDYAWVKHKLLHRDIKPENIMLDTEGEPQIMDLGISKSMIENNSLTMTGVVIGTPYYMSPEQARADKSLDCRSDIYSLGATLFHIMGGEVPYEGTTAISIIAKHISPEPPPSLRSVNKNVSAQCAALVKIMMAKDREARQADWKAVIEDIDRVLAGNYPNPGKTTATSSVDRPAASGTEASGSWKARPMTLLAWGVRIALIAVIAVLVYRLWNVQSGAPKRETAESSENKVSTGASTEAASAKPAPEENAANPENQARPGKERAVAGTTPEAKSEEAKPPETNPPPAPQAAPQRAENENSIRQALAAPVEKAIAEQDRQDEDAWRAMARKQNFGLMKKRVFDAEIELFKGRAGSAAKIMRESADDPALSEFKDEIAELKDIFRAIKTADMEMAHNFKRNPKAIKLPGKDGVFKVYDVKTETQIGEPVYALRSEDGSQRFSVIADAFPVEERLAFVKNPQAAHVLRGMNALKEEDIEGAKREFAKCGLLAAPLTSIAEQPFVLRDAVRIQKAILKRIDPAAVSQEAQADKEDGAKEGDAAAPTRNVKGGDVKGVDVKALFAGIVEQFNPKTLDISLRYDFADQAQLEDWRPDGRGRSFVEWGSLRMGSANDLFLLKHRARFEAFTMNANVEFDGNGLCQGLELRKIDDSLLFVAGAFDLIKKNFSSRYDYCFKGLTMNSMPLSVRNSALKPGAALSTELCLRSHPATIQCYFKVNNARGANEQIRKSPDWLGAAPVLGSKRAMIRYKEITIKGQLSKAWYEAEMARQGQGKGEGDDAPPPPPRRPHPPRP